MSGHKGGTLTARELAAALDYVRADPAIWEVIVTGGDPFLLSPRRIAAIVRALDAVAACRGHPLPHPRAGRRARQGRRGAGRGAGGREGGLCRDPRQSPARAHDGARAACARLAKAGIPLLAQTVLLKGVNDDAATLEALFRGLVAMRVKPYYLHHLDLAPGTGHFRTGLAEGQALLRALRGRVSGLCQPAYVLDLPGGAGKVPVGPLLRPRDRRGGMGDRGSRRQPPCLSATPAGGDF